MARKRVWTVCGLCEKSFQMKESSHRFLIRKNSEQKFFCTRNCAAKHRNKIFPLVPTAEGRAKAWVTYYKTVSRRPSPYLKILLRTAKTRATRFGRSFSITIDDIVAQYNKQNGLCAYTGLTLDITKYRTGVPLPYEVRKLHASIDRIDNDGGYTPENIQLVCTPVNGMKGILSHSDFVDLCKLISARFSA